MDMSKYKALFISETTEHLQAMGENLLLLEREPQNSEAIATVFRNAHSIKGMAASMGFGPICNLAHALEDLMDEFREGSHELGADAVNLMFKGLDLLESMMADVAEDREIQHDIEPIVAQITAFQQDGQTPQTVLDDQDFPELDDKQEQAAVSADAPKHKTLRVIISSQANAPGVRGFLLHKRLEESVQIISCRPDLDSVKAGRLLPDPSGFAMELDIQSDVDENEISKIIDSLTDIQGFEFKYEAAPEQPEQQQPAEPHAEEAVPSRENHAPQQLPQTVRVKTQILDEFINAVGEMILAKSRLREISKRHSTPGLTDELDRMDRLVRDFHDRVMSIRMMPLESVTQRLPRVVRDLAQDQGKQINFEVSGTDIELDRAILEHLSDPFLHLLRNSVDHGIESAQERESAGKPPTGTMALEGLREKDLVVIEIRDDGQGLDPMVLKQTAVKKGMLSVEDAEAMSDEEAFQLIFLAGFSTAKQVDMVSGRGVGMDAVKDAIEGVGGNVTLSSIPGKGTTITLHLPRTIAIVNVLLVRLNQEIFAIPIGKVLKTVEILPFQIRESRKQRFFLDRQELIPMKHLHKYLDMPIPESNGQLVTALMVEVQKRKLALVVDELLGQEEAFIRPLGKPLERISGLSGVTILGDGRIVFVLDTIGLL